MTDVVWTTLITGSTAVLTGGLGWLGARQQTRVELLKLKQEHEPGTAENLKFRQELYLRYLELTDAVWRFASSGDGTIGGFAAAFSALARADDEMELFAANSVIPAQSEMWTVARALLDGTCDEDVDSNEVFIQKFREAHDSLHDAWMTARADLVKALREDVGPDI